MRESYGRAPERAGAIIPDSTAESGDRGYQVGRALFYMALAMILIPCLNASAKFLGSDYPVIEIVWARYAGHFIYMVMTFVPARGWRLFATQHLGSQIVRSGLLLASTAIYFTALRVTPLPLAATIGFVAPFMVIALSGLMLGEEVGLKRWIGAIIGFSGALVILRPGAGVVAWGSFLVVASSACSALYQLLTRRIAAHDSAETSITYISVVGFVVVSLLMPFNWETPHGFRDALLFVGLGLFGGFGHYFIVKAFQCAPASVVAPCNYGQLVGSLIMSVLVFGEFPDFWTWVGASIIVGSGLYVLYVERQPDPRLH